MNVKIEESWKDILKDEFEKEYFIELVDYLKKERAEGRQIYPPGGLIFNAFNKTPFNRVKVVILGQDPYHGAGQAHGLSFSVPEGIRKPPSLENIFKELQNDTGFVPPSHGNLEYWAEQGVLLLNSILTVRASEPTSHAKCGWAHFTDAVIGKISELKTDVVFLLWGSSARRKIEIIDTSRHFVLEAMHPSPFSAQGFFGCKHFSQTNKILKSRGLTEIDWNIPDPSR
ncbi:MAG: uracil-DNA glycosylase [Prevotellaceae bacterium]|jgi:uracil-DNA glycosylase|nr:uracil-DNA glycosylase [Prevotellaceae bacterium]